MPLNTFIAQILGFFIQTLPCAILLFVPFQKHTFKIMRKKIIVLLISFMIIASFIFACISFPFYATDNRYFQELTTYSNLYFTFIVILIVLFFIYVIKEQALKKILVVMMMIHYGAFVFTLSNMIFNFQMDYDSTMYGWDNNSLNLSIYMITAPAIIYFMNRVLRDVLHAMALKTVKRGCIYIIIALFLYCVCIYCLSSSTNNRINDMYLYVLLFATLITDVILYIMFFSEAKISMQNETLIKQVDVFNSQYKKITSNIQETRKIRHDLHHHLNAIATLNSEGKSKELRDYLLQYTTIYQNMDAQKLCGSSAIDTILKYYIEKAQEENIQVKTKIANLDGNLGIDSIDITVLLGNAMDNAIHACKDIVASKIYITITKKGSMLLIEIKNSCHEDEIDSQNFRSTKKKGIHGYGITNMKTVCQKYDGEARYKVENNQFIAQFILTIPYL